LNRFNLGIFVVIPLIAGTVFCIVALVYGAEFLTALKFGGMGVFMALCFSLQALPSSPDKPVPLKSLKKRGLDRKLDFLRRGWESSPVGLLLGLLVGIAFGALMLGGFIVSLLYWALGVPEPFSQPMHQVPGSGPYDVFIFILSGILFTWTVFIPLFDWIERLDAPKSDGGIEKRLF
jgi:hypothetical protein